MCLDQNTHIFFFFTGDNWQKNTMQVVTLTDDRSQPHYFLAKNTHVFSLFSHYFLVKNTCSVCLFCCCCCFPLLVTTGKMTE